MPSTHILRDSKLILTHFSYWKSNETDPVSEPVDLAVIVSWSLVLLLDQGRSAVYQLRLHQPVHKYGQTKTTTQRTMPGFTLLLPGCRILVAGGGSEGNKDGAGRAAQFNRPTGIAVVGAIAVVTDTGNKTIRVIDRPGLTISH